MSKDLNPHRHARRRGDAKPLVDAKPKKTASCKCYTHSIFSFNCRLERQTRPLYQVHWAFKIHARHVYPAAGNLGWPKFLACRLHYVSYRHMYYMYLVFTKDIIFANLKLIFAAFVMSVVSVSQKDDNEHPEESSLRRYRDCYYHLTRVYHGDK